MFEIRSNRLWEFLFIVVLDNKNGVLYSKKLTTWTKGAMEPNVPKVKLIIMKFSPKIEHKVKNDFSGKRNYKSEL